MRERKRERERRTHFGFRIRPAFASPEASAPSLQLSVRQWIHLCVQTRLRRHLRTILAVQGRSHHHRRHRFHHYRIHHHRRIHHPKMWCFLVRRGRTLHQRHLQWTAVPGGRTLQQQVHPVSRHLQWTSRLSPGSCRSCRIPRSWRSSSATSRSRVLRSICG